MKRGDREKIRHLILQSIREWKELRTDVPLTSYIAEWLLQNDLVFAVRCKNCIHWYETEGICLKIYSDGAVSPYAWQDRNPDNFCSYGERKDND